jgi:hypothetical protein
MLILNILRVLAHAERVKRPKRLQPALGFYPLNSRNIRFWEMPSFIRQVKRFGEGKFRFDAFYSRGSRLISQQRFPSRNLPGFSHGISMKTQGQATE